MKKFISRMITLTLVIALAITFTACSFDAGGGVTTNSGDSTGNQTSEVTKTPEELATEEFEAKYAAYTEALNSQTKDEDGNVVEDYYTRSSVTAMQTAMAELEGFTTEGKTAEEINAATAKVEAALANLETVDSHIDGRLQDAITKLKLYKTTTGDASGEDIWYKVEDGRNVVCSKDDEGAFRIADKGVDGIVYDDEKNTATFLLNENSLDKNLTEFIKTNVLEIFEGDFANGGFSDLVALQFHVVVDQTPNDGIDNPEPYVFALDFEPGTEGTGKLLAAGLVAICAGLEQEIYDEVNKEDGNFLNILTPLVSEKYSLINGTSCTATLKFSNGEYVKQDTFTVKFTTNTL